MFLAAIPASTLGLSYLEGQFLGGSCKPGEKGISGVTLWLVGDSNLLTKSP